MRKLKDALRLKFEAGQSHQQIARALGISKGVVTKYVGLAVAAGLDWQAIAAMDEAALERRLLASPRPGDTYAQADYGRIHQELGRKGVTLMLLWEEYCAQVGDEHSAANPVKPWRYSQFCENLSPICQTPQTLHAPGTPRRRETLHRLCRPDAGPDGARPGGGSRQHLCRGHGCLGLLLCLCHARANRTRGSGTACGTD